MKGGPMMWPLLLCAIISVAVMIERTMALRAMTKGGSGLAERAIALLKQGKNEEASRLIEGTQDPAGKLLATAMLNRHLEPKELEGMLELQALEDIPKLSHRLNFLDTIITIAPLLGLLGTVTGMIGAFHVVGDPNNLNSPAAITGGVAEALIATATGLVIAIVTLVGYNSLVERVKQIVSSMEIAGTQAVLFFQPSEQAKETESYEARTTRV
ncbi:MAG TPA: MotA/TolQ/ExbB proton channel family protein [Fimbriimonadaceae bacterium]